MLCFIKPQMNNILLFPSNWRKQITTMVNLLYLYCSFLIILKNQSMWYDKSAFHPITVKVIGPLLNTFILNEYQSFCCGVAKVIYLHLCSVNTVHELLNWTQIFAFYLRREAEYFNRSFSAYKVVWKTKEQT